MLAAHAILLSVTGVPAIYDHSLPGSRNDYKGLEESGINRRINREKLEYGRIVHELENNSRRKSDFSRFETNDGYPPQTAGILALCTAKDP